jgi:hypothetical protein
VCYSRTGLDKLFPVHRFATNQVFEASDDLDIGPAVPGETVRVARVWCDSGFPIELYPESEIPHLTFTVLDPTDQAIPLAGLKGHAHGRGWHTVQVASTATERKPFKVRDTPARSSYKVSCEFSPACHGAGRRAPVAHVDAAAWKACRWIQRRRRIQGALAKSG